MTERMKRAMKQILNVYHPPTQQLLDINQADIICTSILSDPYLDDSQVDWGTIIGRN